MSMIARLNQLRDAGVTVNVCVKHVAQPVNGKIIAIDEGEVTMQLNAFDSRTTSSESKAWFAVESVILIIE